jgi:hypothetical protein
MSAVDRYFYLEQAMGSLRQTQVKGIGITIKSVANKKLGCVVETVSVWSHYGQFNENRIHLLQEGEEKPICIEGVEFWPIIKDENYFQLSTHVNNYHKVTINGRLTNGSLFEETYTIPGDDFLSGIIEIIILIAFIGNAEEAKAFWNAMKRGLGIKYNSPGEHLDKVIHFKEMCEDIIKIHPYMTFSLQQGLRILVQKLKESINLITILK